VRLRGADVIHSFWVPALTGKTDAIPGQNNRTWLQADHPGVFRGQCTEYCGEQHAHMGFEVIAQPPDQFATWWNAQLQGAPPAPSLPPTNAQNAFIAKCGICHTVRGTRAGGRLGPDLTHIMSRRTIGAATLPNTPGQLAAWIADPQHTKPGNFMPQLDLSGPELISIRDYVETLK
jgi:cytochrome c oxidase subunit 2